jgi:prefoldin subunit 5
MYSPIFSQSTLDSFGQFSTSYTNLMFKMLQQNIEQVETLREMLLESDQAVTLEEATDPHSQTEVEQLQLQVKELQTQIEELNRKYAVLENRTRSGRWNKTGSGHFKTT